MQAVADQDLFIPCLDNSTANASALDLNYLTIDNTTFPTSTSAISSTTFNDVCNLFQDVPRQGHQDDYHNNIYDNHPLARGVPVGNNWDGGDLFGSPPSGGVDPPLLLPVEGGDPVLDPLEVQQLLDLGLANLFSSSQQQSQLPPLQQLNSLSWHALSDGTSQLTFNDQSVSGSLSPLGKTDSTLENIFASNPQHQPDSTFSQLLPAFSQLSQSELYAIAAAALTQATVAPLQDSCSSIDGSTPPLSAPDALFSSYLYSPSTFHTSPAQSSYSPLDNQFISLAGTEPFFAPLSHLVQDTKPVDLTPEQIQALALALLPQQPPPQQPPPAPSIASSVGPIRRKRTNLPSAEGVGGGDGENATDESEERRHKCDFPGCARAFKRLFNLKAHKRTHNPERDRPFSCDICHATFIRAHDLTRHQPVHTKLKEWNCERCGKGFTRKDALDRHNANPTACRAKRLSLEGGEHLR